MRAREFKKYERAFRALFFDKNGKQLNPNGKMVLDYLSQVCYVLNTDVPQNEPDAYSRLAKQAIFNDILKLLKFDYSWHLEQTEDLNRQSRDERFLNTD